MNLTLILLAYDIIGVVDTCERCSPPSFQFDYNMIELTAAAPTMRFVFKGAAVVDASHRLSRD